MYVASSSKGQSRGRIGGMDGPLQKQYLLLPAEPLSLLPHLKVLKRVFYVAWPQPSNLRVSLFFPTKCWHYTSLCTTTSGFVLPFLKIRFIHLKKCLMCALPTCMYVHYLHA